jgi:hypothetical protein
MLAAYPHNQGGDGPLFQEVIEAARVSWGHWHELPLWNPYQCGGVPLWDNPEGLGAAPTMWIFLPFGTTRAIELWFITHVLAAFVSMWIFARRDLRLTAPASIFAASVWAFCGYFEEHLSGGHLSWVAFAYLPLGLFLWRRAEKDARFAIGLGMLVALEMHEGATYALPHMVVLLGAETLTRAWPPRRLLHIARAGAIVGVVALCLSATRTLPVLDQLRSHTRELGDETDALQWSTLKEMFIARSHSRGVAGQQYVWPEFAAYVGPFVLALAVVGLFVGGLESMWLIALFAFSFALMLGHADKYAPWTVLKAHLYPFKEMRVPSRFNAAVTMFIAIFAAIAVDRISQRTRRFVRSVRVSDGVRLALLVIAFMSVGDIMAIGIDRCFGEFVGAPSNDTIAVSPRLYIAESGLAQFTDQPTQGLARTECWGEWSFHKDAKVWLGDVPQARAEDAAAASVAHVVRTQNTFRFDVEARQPTRILLDTAYDHGWRTNVGAITAFDDDLLALDVPAGSNHVVVKYWPHGLTLGMWLTSLSTIGIAAFFVWDARRRRRA